MSDKSQMLDPEERVLSTLNQDGSRRWIRPKVSKGKWWKRRFVVGWSLILAFNLIPWLRIAGEPILLLDVVHRQFTFFTFTFRPTETLLLVFLMLSIFVGIFLLTSLFGRVWCGWTCPQTVYLEFLYRPLERFIEGPNAQKGKPVALPRKIAKYVAYFAISFHLSHTFLAYFVSPEILLEWSFGNPSEHTVGFGIVLGITAMMVFNFVWFREQMCILACPYGRLQSVLLDRNSLVVGYDENRGEPRGKKKKKLAEGAPKIGDCIDCNWCKAVCPTGIDIRDGLQMECIHCTECIDACDNIMEKIDRPTGLIRYSSQHALEGNPVRFLRPRTVLYPVIMAIALSAFVLQLNSLESAFILPVRVQNIPFTRIEDTGVRNILAFRLENQSEETHTYQIAMLDEAHILTAPTFPMTLQAGQAQEFSVIIESPLSEFTNGKSRILFHFKDDADFDKEVERTVLGPITLNLNR